LTGADMTSGDVWDRINGFFTNVVGWFPLKAAIIGGYAYGFLNKCGFLFQCCDIVVKCFSLLMNSLGTAKDAIFQWDSISLFGSTVIPSGSINLNEACMNSGLDLLHNLCKLCLDGSILVFMSLKTYNKALELLKHA
jgi:hypothetical protein